MLFRSKVCYNFYMINLAKYAGLKICVAVSGGRDSMALLHYLNIHAVEYGITLSALNCDHRIRGEASKRDSEFVKKWCKANEIPLLTFVWKDYETEKKNILRQYRKPCAFLAYRLLFQGDAAALSSRRHTVAGSGRGCNGAPLKRQCGNGFIQPCKRYCPCRNERHNRQPPIRL